MIATTTLPQPEDENLNPRVVYLPLQLSTPPTIVPAEPGALAATPVRLHRIKIIIQEMPGIKQIEPSPHDCDPDACGSVYFNVVVSMLYDVRTLIAAIENLNALPPMPAAYDEVEVRA